MKPRWQVPAVAFFMIWAVVSFARPAHAAEQSSFAPIYTYREQHDPDGIGKFYFGREIAQVMGHEGAER
ncbi:MAG: hypothetical protein HY043_07370 [Verrucomicrobia bacterium]|nr:hypothetical protein [Verrucomicrobiota bacterium]